MRNTLGLPLVFCLALSLTAAPVRADGAEDKAVAAVTKLGGTITRDEKAAGKPVIEVDFNKAPATDAGLKELAAFKQLLTLKITNHFGGEKVTPVTNAGLKELASLKSLQTLGFSGTKVTTAGVKELQAALPELKINR